MMASTNKNIAKRDFTILSIIFMIIIIIILTHFVLCNWTVQKLIRIFSFENVACLHLFTVSVAYTMQRNEPRCTELLSYPLKPQFCDFVVVVAAFIIVKVHHYQLEVWESDEHNIAIVLCFISKGYSWA